MSLVDLAQFGAVIFIAGVLYFVIKEFLKFMRKQEDNFTEIIKNHLHDDTEAKNKLEQSHLKLAMMIEHLIKWLAKNNH